MRLAIERKSVKIYPNSRRVIARFFFSSDERAKGIIEKVMAMSDEDVLPIILPLLQEYSKRHRNITKIFERNCKKLKYLFDKMDIDHDNMDKMRRMLIGSYFTHEYSTESAAFFNPSIIEDPDQSELEEGRKRVIISFRAVGEGHISSIAFRRALIDENNEIEVIDEGNYIDEAEVVRTAMYQKKLFLNNAINTQIKSDVLNKIGHMLDDEFDYTTLRKLIIKTTELEDDETMKVEYEKVLWLADSYHDIVFSLDTDISDRVIFPISEFEKKGIEDARFVKFTDDKGESCYYATYTAYDGIMIMPKLLKTSDFYHFEIKPLYGDGAQNKNLALFPRKINGQFAMISRIDGVNNYIMYSHNINVWEKPQMLQQPKFSWEYIQIGNCGSPIETEEGWLIITHGVGPMRRYCLGASLLKLDDPTVEIGRLREPLLIPRNDEREGYVPNVLYSCGSIVHNGELIIPYGLSDYGSAFASVNLSALLDKLLSD
ncbi:MAG: glycoside hydrolase family 130 protein [Mucilaginibacter polytrichastri]|nr:glycoside hydrolase family 130 protein [Mucilaginibacter polytrichastri]